MNHARPAGTPAGSSPRIPIATYRLQFGEQFTLRDATAIVPYLSALGISDCYASPILRAKRSSTHGYDVTDHNEIDPRIGTYDDLTAFARALREHDMGLILDVVPNHMGIGEGTNAWWMDVLEYGLASPYAAYFDIDWRRDVPGLSNRVLLPLLEDQYGVVLEAGLLRIVYAPPDFQLRYHDRRLPVAPSTYARILEPLLDALRASGAIQSTDLDEFSAIVAAFRALPGRDEPDHERGVAGREWARDLKRRLAAFMEAHHAVRDARTKTLAMLNGTPGAPDSFDRLDDLLDAQAYRLAYWRVAADEINYRRFFDINELAAIRVEDPAVFEDTHRLILKALGERVATGVRVDHPDGLLKPAEYAERLQQRFADVIGVSGPSGGRPLYLVVEKILDEGESLNPTWPVYGTTGYDFAAQLNGVFVDQRARRAFDRIYQVFTGHEERFPEITNVTRKLIMLVSFAGEIQALGRQLDELSARNRRYRDFTMNTLTFALREVIAALPVYRTYISAEQAPSLRDVACVDEAVREARRRNPRTAAAVFEFIGDTLLMRNLDTFNEEDRPAVREFILRWQQTTGPVMAKGVEDTAFYRYNRLISLNEVGSDPGTFGRRLSAFHRDAAARARAWPHAMLASSTHDTKRSEDVRARINVLSEIPSEWRTTLHRWATMNAPHVTVAQGRPAPDRNDECLLYQTLVGMWPGDVSQVAGVRERAVTYMLKAIREAKVHTSWIEPNTTYEEAVERFVRSILETPDSPFVADLDRFVNRIAAAAYVNSLSQLIVKLTAPGVPDIYQGTEVWNLRLVDPDNRQPVDFSALQRRLDALQSADPGSLLGTYEDGRIKQFVLSRALAFRQARRGIYQSASYTPLLASGPRSDRIIAFARRQGGQWAITVAPRLVEPLCRAGRLPVADAWNGLRLRLPSAAPARWRNTLTGREIEADDAQSRHSALDIATVFADLPVALLHGER